MRNSPSAKGRPNNGVSAPPADRETWDHPCPVLNRHGRLSRTAQALSGHTEVGQRTNHQRFQTNADLQQRTCYSTSSFERSIDTHSTSAESFHAVIHGYWKG